MFVLMSGFTTLEAEYIAKRYGATFLSTVEETREAIWRGGRRPYFFMAGTAVDGYLMGKHIHTINFRVWQLLYYAEAGYFAENGFVGMDMNAALRCADNYIIFWDIKASVDNDAIVDFMENPSIDKVLDVYWTRRSVAVPANKDLIEGLLEKGADARYLMVTPEPRDDDRFRVLKVDDGFGIEDWKKMRAMELEQFYRIYDYLELDKDVKMVKRLAGWKGKD